jgi:hypothetical protein
MHSIGDLVLAYTVNDYVVFGIITDKDEEYQIYFVSWFIDNSIVIEHYNQANIKALKQNLIELLERDKIMI